MYSSRMRTARLLPVSPSLHCVGVVSAPGEGLLRGRVCSGGVVSALGGSAPGGCLLLGGLLQGDLVWGVSAPGGSFPGVYPSMQCGRPSPREQNS